LFASIEIYAKIFALAFMHHSMSLTLDSFLSVNFPGSR
jgi:hypothetical protein